METPAFNFNKLTSEEYTKLVKAAVAAGVTIITLIGMGVKIEDLVKILGDQAHEIIEIIRKGRAGAGHSFL